MFYLSRKKRTETTYLNEEKGAVLAGWEKTALEW
jgi:hypothetical protein